MLISRKHKALLLHLRDPEIVLSTIPQARHVEYRKKDLVVVPFGLDEARVLNNLGIKAPSPIVMEYDWPSQKFRPIVSQKIRASFWTLESRGYDLSEIGTGKSITALWAWDYLRKNGRAKKLLVLCPMSTMDRTWADEVFSAFMGMEFEVLHGTREKRLRLLANTKADVYILNHDGLKVKGVVEALNEREDIDTVIIDEVSAFRTKRTERWKFANLLVNKCGFSRRVMAMTGSPTPNALTDSWAQAMLVTPNTAPKSFVRYRDMLMYRVSMFRWIEREGAQEIVHKVMSPSVRFRRDECFDLPPVTYETREVSLAKEQKRAYTQMLNELAVKIKRKEIVAANMGVQLGKLLQILCGVIYDNEGNEVAIPNAAREAELLDIYQQAGGKVIVFVPFTAALERVVDVTKAKGYSTAKIDGSTPRAERSRIFFDFQNSKKPDILIANPATMSHGLTLTAANTIVWYAPTTKNEVFIQANGRISRAGQTRRQHIIMLQASGTEGRVYRNLFNKQKAENILLDLVEEDTYDVA